jgi:NAD-dependent deacetylase
MNNTDAMQNLKDIVAGSKKIAFFGGAGVSTESGIPDFRSTDGLYNTEYKYPPETIISHTFFIREPSEFYRFYRNKMLFLDALPNPAHNWLANNQIPVITQNIDGLHQVAGSNEVYELHGSVWRNYCTKCKHFMDLNALVAAIDSASDYIPKCPNNDCNGIMKPDVVLYEEGLDDYVWRGAQNVLENADTLIIGGTSLIVYPAASIINYFHGKNLVVINKQPLNISNTSPANTIQINAPIGEVFSEL